MTTRSYTFIVGPETDTLPTVTAPSSDDDFVTRGYINTIRGTYNTPETFTATGITPTANVWREVIFTESNGGEVDISTNPQIADGDLVGQQLILWGTSNTDYLLFENANGLNLNGQMALKAVECLGLMWNGNQWAEMFRRYNG